MGKSILCLICKLFGHKWKPWENMGLSLYQLFVGNRLARSCKRCGESERTY